MKPDMFDKVKRALKNNPELEPYNIYLMFRSKYGEEEVGQWEYYRKRDSGYWNIKRNVVNSASLYTSKSTWKEECQGAYSSSKKHGWFSECVAHMESRKDWKVFEVVYSSAKSFSSVKEWRKNHPGAMSSAQTNGWFDLCARHMTDTDEYKARRSKRNDMIKPKGYWDDKSKVIESARKHLTKSSWKNTEYLAFRSAELHGWLIESLSHMKGAGYWNVYENVLSSAIRFETTKEWRSSCPSSYRSAKNSRWLEMCSAHMEVPYSKKKKWSTFEQALESAKQYNTIREWQRGCSSAVRLARKNNWMNRCTLHMQKPSRKPPGYWDDFQKVEESSKKYSSKTEWQNAESAAVASAKRNGWFSRCTAHMSKSCKERAPLGYWQNKDNVLSSAKYCKTLPEWRERFYTASRVARTKGWVAECIEQINQG